MWRRRFLPCLLCLLLVAPARAAEPAPRALLQHALEQWSHEIDRWSFVQHVREYRGTKLRETRRERFDPTQPDGSRWQLLEINGRAPTPDEKRAFDLRKNRRPRMHVESPTHYVDFDRVEVVAATPERIEFHVPLRDDMSLLVPFEDIALRIAVDPRSSAILRVDVGIREEMRIAFGIARVTKLAMTFSLAPAGGNTAPPPEARAEGVDAAPAEIAPDTSASATISRLGRRAEITWSDFVRVQEPAAGEVAEN